LENVPADADVQSRDAHFLLSGCINKQNLQNEVTAITKENGKYCSFLE
jgi:hypothetical protein